MPTPAQFFRYCPSETAASGATNAIDFGTFVVSGSLPALQTTLGDYLDLDGRAAEATTLNLGSYLVDPTSQALHALSDDMLLSYAAIGATPVLGMGGYFDFHAAIVLGLPDPSGVRTASLGTAALLRHLAVGSRVHVQTEGDTVSQVECDVVAVTATTLTLTPLVAGSLPEVETALVTAIYMSDVLRAEDVVSFRQFRRFASPLVAADEASFNPNLYLLLYGPIYPDVVGMTASQMYDDYSGHPGRVGSILDLRRALDAPSVATLVIDNLLDIAPGAAIRMENVLVRTIATLADVIADLPDSRSDVALITAAATRELVEASIRDLQQVVVSENITATHSITLPGTLAATLDFVRIDVPTQVPALQATDIRTDGLVSAHLTTDTVVSTRSDLGDAQATTLAATRVTADTAAFKDATVSGALSGESAAFSAGIAADSGEFQTIAAGHAATDTLQVNDALTGGSAAFEGDVSCRNLTASGSITAAAGVSGATADFSSSLNVGTAFSADGGAATFTVPVSAPAAAIANVSADLVNSERVVTDAVTVDVADVANLTAGNADVSLLTVANVSGGLRVTGDSTFDAISCTNFKTDVVDADSAVYRNLGVTALADIASLVVGDDAIIGRMAQAYRLVSSQLDVTGAAALGSLAVSAASVLHSLNVVTDVGIAGNVTIAGTHDAGPSRIRGNLTLMGDISTQRAIVDGDIFSEHGDLHLTRGSADLYGDLSMGGAASIGGDLAVKGGATFGSDIRVTGGFLGTGDVSGANAEFSGVLRAGDAAVQDLDCLGIRAETVMLLGAFSTEGDASVDGYLSVEGNAVLKGSVTAGDLTSIGDVESGRDVNVTRRLNVAEDAAIDGDLQVSGNAAVEGVFVCDGAEVTGTLVVTDVTVAADVSVEGKITADGIIEAGGNLVTGGDLLVSGDAFAENVTVASSATVNGNLALAGNAEVEGFVSTVGDLTVGGSVQVDGSVVIDAGLTVVDGVNAASVKTDDLTAETVSTKRITTDELAAGCLEVLPTGVAVTRSLACGSLDVNGPVSVHGPVMLDSTIDFGTEPTVFRSEVSVPYLAAGAVTTQEVHVRRIVIAPPYEDTIGTFGDPTPSAVQGRITALEGQVASLTAQIQALMDLIVN
jgi:predicted acyltransferase (DUF342 family)